MLEDTKLQCFSLEGTQSHTRYTNAHPSQDRILWHLQSQRRIFFKCGAAVEKQTDAPPPLLAREKKLFRLGHVRREVGQRGREKSPTLPQGPRVHSSADGLLHSSSCQREPLS